MKRDEMERLTNFEDGRHCGLEHRNASPAVKMHLQQVWDWNRSFLTGLRAGLRGLEDQP